MAKKRRSQPAPEESGSRPGCVRWLIAGLFAVVMLVVLGVIEVQLPGFDVLDSPDDAGIGDQRIINPEAPLAAFFEPTVLYWRADILRTAQIYGVNPNVIAIVMQIESCGDPTAISVAGATGLMQVMPFHFEDGENMLNPQANMELGLDIFVECLTQFADWDLGLALACYNGGPGVTVVDPLSWVPETRAYYRWATGLWADVVSGVETSQTLTEWLAAGGAGLCQEAANRLPIAPVAALS